MKFVQLFLRLALSAGFLSAVADRFGIWNQNVVWGDWQNFVEYTGSLLPFFSDAVVSVFAITATVLEIVFAIGLLLGWQTKVFAFLSGCLLLIFGLAMAFASGIKEPLDFSVFSASAAGFALMAFPEGYLTVDHLRRKRGVYRF